MTGLVTGYNITASFEEEIVKKVILCLPKRKTLYFVNVFNSIKEKILRNVTEMKQPQRRATL